MGDTTIVIKILEKTLPRLPRECRYKLEDFHDDLNGRDNHNFCWFIRSLYSDMKWARRKE